MPSPKHSLNPTVMSRRRRRRMVLKHLFNRLAPLGRVLLARNGADPLRLQLRLLAHYLPPDPCEHARGGTSPGILAPVQADGYPPFHPIESIVPRVPVRRLDDVGPMITTVAATGAPASRIISLSRVQQIRRRHSRHPLASIAPQGLLISLRQLCRPSNNLWNLAPAYRTRSLLAVRYHRWQHHHHLGLSTITPCNLVPWARVRQRHNSGMEMGMVQTDRPWIYIHRLRKTRRRSTRTHHLGMGRRWTVVILGMR